MANEPNATPQAEGYIMSPNTITAEDYQTIKQEREELQQKQLAADNEFMYQHYARLLRMMDVSYERATKANIVLERKARRAEGKQKVEAIRAARKQHKEG